MYSTGWPWCSMVLHGPLVLVQEGDGPDQRQVLGVVPSGAGLVVEEGQCFGEGVGHQQGPQQPLGVAVQGQVVC